MQRGRASLSDPYIDDLGSRLRLQINSSEGQAAGRNLDSALWHNRHADIDRLRATLDRFRCLVSEGHPTAVDAGQ